MYIYIYTHIYGSLPREGLRACAPLTEVDDDGGAIPDEGDVGVCLHAFARCRACCTQRARSPHYSMCV